MGDVELKENLERNLSFYLGNYYGDSKEQLGKEVSKVVSQNYPRLDWLVGAFEAGQVSALCNENCLFLPKADGANDLVLAWAERFQQPLDFDDLFPKAAVRLDLQGQAQVAAFVDKLTH